MSESLGAYWLKLPLASPYRLSFGTVYSYDSFIVLIPVDEGFVWGEATALPGYSWETADSIWSNILHCIKRADDDIDVLEKEASALQESSPFAASALLTAIEKYNGLIDYDLPRMEEGIPLAGFVGGKEEKDISTQVEGLIGCGYCTLKIKLSRDVKDDVRRIQLIQGLIDPPVKIRLDANQAYTVEMVKYLEDNIQADTVELLEQPFGKDEWQRIESLAKWIPIPIMLDESIWSAEDIRRASECGVSLIKLKLVKHGSILRTCDLIDQARGRGLDVVLGNGVQTDFGCIDECYVYVRKQISRAGEMNGFLKMRNPLLPAILTSRDDKAVVARIHQPIAYEKFKLSDKYMSKQFHL